MHTSAPIRALLIAIVCCLLTAGWATAETAVQHHRREATQAARQLHRARIEHRRAIHRFRVERARARELVGVNGRIDSSRWTPIRRWAVREIRRTDRAIRLEHRSFRRSVSRLERARRSHQGWLATYAVFEVCPVPGYSFIHDDFGEIVRQPRVDPHVHMGSDVTAPYGSRIVAPFDGRAVASSSELGGYQVRVYGARGYVYNAHLSGFGRTGYVRAGDTIGYVGSTGLSTAPHDHIEWHPGGGGAVDPYPYLRLACVG